MSERLRACARCGHARRVITGRCRHRQADAACADLRAPPCRLPAGSGTYTLCVMPRYVMGADIVASALVCRRQQERRSYENIPFVVDRGATRACAAALDG